MIKDKLWHQSSFHSVIYSFPLAARWICTKTAQADREKKESLPKPLNSCSAKQIPVSLYNGSAVILTLIKVDC